MLISLRWCWRLYDWIKKIRQEWICVLTGGHYRVFHLEEKRVCLKCVSCGAQTPGWNWAK
jgi:hypothetical protein